jgi:hypothetical protein
LKRAFAEYVDRRLYRTATEEVVAFIALSGAGTIEHNFLKKCFKDQV